jgi:alpha-methylacyl-CoA racemase
MTGPLDGLKVIEFAGIGPAPYAAMLLADLGADILCVDRESGRDWPRLPIVSRGRAFLSADLKDPATVERCLEAIARADVLIEGFRPGVMERLGLGPNIAFERNPALIYGRVTGWGQSGPMAQVAGHDINYLALSGALAPLQTDSGRPVPPLNMLGDYAGGALFLVTGVLAALFERAKTGLGQVIDAAIVDGAASLLAPLLGMQRGGLLELDPARNMLGGRCAPFYRTYRCADGKYLAIGPLESRFRETLWAALNLSPGELGDPDDPSHWPEACRRLEALFLTRPRDEWAAEFASAEMCLTPVLSPEEAAGHPHLRSRGTYAITAEGPESAPAPRFSRHSPVTKATGPITESGEDRLRRWGVPLMRSVPDSQRGPPASGRSV